MRQHLRSRLREYEIVDCFDQRRTPAVKEFFNTESALSFLRNFQDDYFGMALLRDIAAERHYCLSTTNLNDLRVLQLIAGDLAAGRLKILDKRRREIPIGGAKEEEVAVAEPPPEPEAVVETETHWLEIEMVGEDYQPISRMRYEIRRADGKTVAKGRLDGRGFIRAEVPEKDSYLVTFPDLDKEACERI